MKYELKNELGHTVLCLREHMTHADRVNFDNLIPGLIRGGQSIVIDLAELNYMDSAGLGMLLSLRDKAGKTRIPLKLRKPKGDVKELMTLACMENLIPIEWQ